MKYLLYGSGLLLLLLVVGAVAVRKLADRVSPDSTPPRLELRLLTNVEPSTSPGGETTFVVGDGEELRVRLRVFAEDAVDPRVVPAASYLDGDLGDVPIDLVWNESGWWEQADPEGLVMTRTTNWITVEASDRAGNRAEQRRFFEIRDEPFFSGELEVLELAWEETGEDQLAVTGRLRLTSQQFDVADLHPDTISLYFIDESRRGLDAIASAPDGPCPKARSRPSIERLTEPDAALVVSFTRCFPRLPGRIELMGRSTWEDRRFTFIAGTDATWR